MLEYKNCCIYKSISQLTGLPGPVCLTNKGTPLVADRPTTVHAAIVFAWLVNVMYVLKTYYFYLRLIQTDASDRQEIVVYVDLYRKLASRHTNRCQ